MTLNISEKKELETFTLGRLPAWQKIHWKFCVYEETSLCREKMKKLLWEILEFFYHLLYRYHSKSLFTCHLLTKWKISLPLISDSRSTFYFLPFTLISYPNGKPNNNSRRTFFAIDFNLELTPNSKPNNNSRKYISI